MKYYIKLVWQTLKVFVLFTGSTVLFYFGFKWINEEYENMHRYDEPEGAAVKVFRLEENMNWYERLLLYFMDGE
ncbi:YqzK family protein [Aeribacillus pallidus]|jgi:hypothetical protein|uniref:YqzK family protein n=1 Tax=Aeribacillus pallidus TaxID=33936 RepID=UPI001DE09345|nr:YqzK family protein [Bacillus sp. (in: firmicutes)]